MNVRGVIGGVGGTSEKFGAGLTCTGVNHPAELELATPALHDGGVGGGGGRATLPCGGAGGAP